MIRTLWGRSGVLSPTTQNDMENWLTEYIVEGSSARAAPEQDVAVDAKKTLQPKRSEVLEETQGLSAPMEPSSSVPDRSYNDTPTIHTENHCACLEVTAP